RVSRNFRSESIQRCWEMIPDLMLRIQEEIFKYGFRSERNESGMNSLVVSDSAGRVAVLEFRPYHAKRLYGEGIPVFLCASRDNVYFTLTEPSSRSSIDDVVV